MNEFDLRKNITGMACAVLIIVLGFLMFVKPHLGGSQPSASSTVSSVSVQANAETDKTAAAAFRSLTSQRLADGFAAQSIDQSLKVSATPLSAGPGVAKAQVKVSGDMPAMVGYMASLAQHLYFDPSTHQLAGTGPLFQIGNLSWSQPTPSAGTATFDVTVYSQQAATP